MPTFYARCEGDSFSDNIEADSFEDAAQKFAQQLHSEEGVLRDDGDSVRIEISPTGTSWFDAKTFEAWSIVTVNIEVLEQAKL